MILHKRSNDKMHLYYATRDGQSRRIASHISSKLTAAGVETTVVDLAEAPPSASQLAESPLVVLIASVRYGRHLPEAESLISLYRTLGSPPPLVLASINLTARKPGKDTAEGNAYLRKWIARQDLKPALAAAIAGRLDYPRYGWFDRQMIRLIMKMTGGPTDPRAQVEYTSWPAVDDFSRKIAELYQTRR